MDLKRWILILTGTAITMLVAFENQYPLVYPDTGAYIASGFEAKALNDRPIIYGLFIRHVSLAVNLWLVIILQSFLVNWLIYELFRWLTAPKLTPFTYLLTVLLLSVGTSFSLVSSMLLPDIFSATSFIAFVLLLYQKETSKYSIIWLSILYILSFTTHLSNLPIYLSLLVGLWALNLFISKRRTVRLPLVSALTGIAILIIPLSNALFGLGFRFKSDGNAFAINHLIEIGVLQQYLQENCSDGQPYLLCAYQDELGWNFLWNDDSPLQKTGGIEANKMDFEAILSDVYSDPHYLSTIVAQTIPQTFKQLFYWDGEVVGPQLEGSAPYGQISWHYHNQITQYISSKQNKGIFDFQFRNLIQDIWIYLSLLFLVTIAAYPKPFNFLSSDFVDLVRIFLVFSIISAFYCSNLSVVDARYSSRIMWIACLLSLLAFNQYYARIINRNGAK